MITRDFQTIYCDSCNRPIFHIEGVFHGFAVHTLVLCNKCYKPFKEVKP